MVENIFNKDFKVINITEEDIEKYTVVVFSRFFNSQYGIELFDLNGEQILKKLIFTATFILKLPKNLRMIKLYDYNGRAEFGNIPTQWVSPPPMCGIKTEYQKLLNNLEVM